MFGLFGVRKSWMEKLAKPVPFEQVKQRVRIVVIDDQKDDFPVEALQQSGYLIEWWSKLDAAGLQRLEDAAFDIIVLDIQGVVVDGLSETGDARGVLLRLRDASPKQIVVACSGQTFDIGSTDFFKQADDILAKPVTVTAAKGVIDNLIKTRISPTQYWEAVVALLQEAHVDEARINDLQKEFAKTAQRGGLMTQERISDIVGKGKVVIKVVGLLRQLYHVFLQS